MKRITVLALLALLIGGCAAPFGDGDSAQDPGENEESQSGAVRTLNGQMQRPAEAVGTLDEQPMNAESTRIYELFRGVHQADVELGPKYSRSTK